MASPACPKTYSHGIDVRFMANESLSAHRIPHVPQLDRGITGTRHKGAAIGGQRQGHHIPTVSSKTHCLLTCLNVPQGTGEMIGRRDQRGTG